MKPDTWLLPQSEPEIKKLKGIRRSPWRILNEPFYVRTTMLKMLLQLWVPVAVVGILCFFVGKYVP